jgi:hypothetical protein
MGINVQPGPGYPTHYIEWHTCLSLGFQAHLVSFITEGVFGRFPGFRVVMVEGGVSWLPALMWRLDAEWKALRSEVPWLTRAPSEYRGDHLRLTTQPLERHASDKHLMNIFEAMDAGRVLMFSSDYPHWDLDSPRPGATLPHSGTNSTPRASSHQRAAAKSRPSSKGDPRSWMPRGKPPWLSPVGKATTGSPARVQGIWKRLSPVFPRPCGAGSGIEGTIRASTCSRTSPTLRPKRRLNLWACR